MEIKEVHVYGAGRVYCPSTGEVILDPQGEDVNTSAKAFAGYWHFDFLDEPEIKDPELAKAWRAHFDAISEDDDAGKEFYESVEEFLAGYQKPGWIVYCCTFHGMACGPVSYTVYFVVLADTIVEEADEDSNPEPSVEA